jgi:hypothetical protein
MLIGPTTGSAYRVNGITGHLGTQIWELLPNYSIRQVMKGHPIPTTINTGYLTYPIAGKRKRLLQCR